MPVKSEQWAVRATVDAVRLLLGMDPLYTQLDDGRKPRRDSGAVREYSAYSLGDPSLREEDSAYTLRRPK